MHLLLQVRRRNARRRKGNNLQLCNRGLPNGVCLSILRRAQHRHVEQHSLLRGPQYKQPTVGTGHSRRCSTRGLRGGNSYHRLPHDVIQPSKEVAALGEEVKYLHHLARRPIQIVPFGPVGLGEIKPDDEDDGGNTIQ